MKTYYVSRKKWLRGQGEKSSALLRKDGMRCCLGFVGEQCKIPRKALINKKTPISLKVDIRDRWPKWMVGAGLHINSEDAYTAMRTNDDEGMTEREREKRLREIFRANGDRIVFRP